MDTLDKQEKEILESALQKLREDERKRQVKEEAKRWTEITVPLSLGSGLTRLTKNDLLRIASHLEIKGLSQLKKQEIIDELQKRIPEQIHKLLHYFDEDRYRFIEKAVQNNGFTTKFKLDSEQLEYFVLRGMLFPGTVDGKRALVMPQEVVLAMQGTLSEQIYSQVHKNTELIKLTHGMLYYYGILNISQLTEMLEKFLDEPIGFHDLFVLLHEAIDYYGVIRLDTVGYAYSSVFDSNKLKEEQQARLGVKYYPFSKEEFIRAGQTGFVDRNFAYKDFVNFIRNIYQITPEEADDLAEECVYATNIGDSLHDVLEFLQSQLEIDNFEMLQILVDHVVHLMNHTRQWMLKGHTPKELSADKRQSRPEPAGRDNVFDFANKKKVGRNDPCPCGSGKKFKKCCGAGK